jgi:predicted HAD superfamily Cof-like phosphohydrolase
MTMFSDVYDFHVLFDLPVAATAGLPEPAERSLRQRLLSEEFAEYRAAEAESDIIEVADALADIAYLVCGTAIVYGLAPKGHFSARFANFGSLLMRPALPTGDRASQRVSRMAQISRAHDAYTQAEGRDDLAGINQALQDLLDAAFTCAYIYSIPLASVFAEVHRSNMAKRVDGVVLRRADGKIIKPPGWQPPNIQAVLFPDPAAKVATAA